MKKVFYLLIFALLLSACQSQETQNKIQKENKQIVKCTFVGDMLYEQPYYDWIQIDTQDKGYYNLVKPYFQKDNLSIANLEVPIGGNELKKSGVGYSFNTTRDIGNQIASLGLEVVSTANNHANDRGNQGINNTLDFLNEKNILAVGTYYNNADRKKGKYKTINGIKFGFVSYTYATNQIIDVKNRDKIALLNEPTNRKFTKEYKEKLTKEVSETRANCDILIAMMHWGTEFTYDITSQQKEVANLLSDLGVNIIIGNHPHCSQTVEWIKNKTLCMYSLGNFISADPYVKRTNQELKNAYNVSLMVNLDIEKNDEKISITNINYIPIINYYDKYLKNFLLVPYNQYNETLEKSHYHYQNGFTKQWIQNTYKKLINIKG